MMSFLKNDSIIFFFVVLAFVLWYMINTQTFIESKNRKPRPTLVLPKKSKVKEKETSFISNNVEETSNKDFIEYDSENLPCDDGPYVWDKGQQHREGIGAQFLLRKHSFIVTGILKAKWIGQLINGHDGYRNNETLKQLKMKDIANYFGISVQECNAKSLSRIESTNNSLHQFFYTNQDDCLEDKVLVPRKCLHHLDITQRTVIVFGWHKRTADYYYSAFNQYFRQKFHQKLKERLEIGVQQSNSLHTRKRKSGEFWVSIHFRWGDLRGIKRFRNVLDPNIPNKRMGLGLKDFCACIQRVLDFNSKASIFLFAQKIENIKDYKKQCPILRKVEVISHSASWKDDLDIMVQSQLLIGGDSGYFALGSFLCEECKVISSSSMRFKISPKERKMFNMLNEDVGYITPVSCTTYLNESYYPRDYQRGDLGCFLRAIDSFMTSFG